MKKKYQDVNVKKIVVTEVMKLEIELNVTANEIGKREKLVLKEKGKKLNHENDPDQGKMIRFN